MCINFNCVGLKSFNSSNESDTFLDIEFFPFDNNVYSSSIKTIICRKVSDKLEMPIINLNSAEKVYLTFDDLSEKHQNYTYKLIHCNYNWSKSDLTESEYLQGFFENFIRDYSYSFNTAVRYINYSVVIPNEDVSIKKSGNYYLVVFDEQKKPVLSRKMMVCDPKVYIYPEIKRATLTHQKSHKQEIDFFINHSGYSITHPFSDLHVTILQNERWDNALTDLKPLFIKNEQLEYNYEDKNTFFGGNEFRYFDTKSIKFYSMNVKNIEFDSVYNVYLKPTIKRSFQNYSTSYDINGKRLIRRLESDDIGNHNSDADYCFVHFDLKYEKQLLNGDIYIFGELTNWDILPEAKLKYDISTMSYKTSLLLKQGYYNYCYVFVDDDNPFIDETFIEGSHYETENEYIILAYYREIGSRYDKLVAMNTINFSY